MYCIRSICRQALSALDHMHMGRIAHRDLKPENILVTNWDTQSDIATIKLADFGLTSTGSYHGSICGTPGYEPPEVEEARANMKKHGIRPTEREVEYSFVDIWALGRIIGMLVLSHGKLGRPQQALDLIAWMKARKWHDRPTAWECLQQPWMTSIHMPDNLLSQKRARSPSAEATDVGSLSGQPRQKEFREASDKSVVQERPRKAVRRMSPESVEEAIPRSDRTANAASLVARGFLRPSILEDSVHPEQRLPHASSQYSGQSGDLLRLDSLNLDGSTTSRSDAPSPQRISTGGASSIHRQSSSSMSMDDSEAAMYSYGHEIHQ